MDLAPGTSSRASCPACTAARTSANRSSSASTANIPGATICAYVDWKVWAKQDRFYVKQFEEDTNLRGTLLVDVSGSMRYGRGRDEQVRIRLHGGRQPGLPAAAAAGRRGLRGLRRRASRTTVPLRTRRNHLDSIIQALDVSDPRNKTELIQFFAKWPRPIPAAA